MQQISDFLEQAAPQLAAISDSPELDAQVLLADVLDKPRTWLAAHPETHLTQAQLATVKTALSRLEAGEPLPYVLGHWEFFGLDLEITPNVLVPRPETELMVECAIKRLNAAPERRSIADVGTGSGCISIAIAKNILGAKVVATDISRPALEVARRNARRHNVAKRIDFIQCDLLPPDPDPHFDLICANLPYIPTDTLRELSVYEREPTLALDGGGDGLDIIRRLMKIAPEWLVPNGMILLEIEASQGMSAVALANETYDCADIRLHQDLAGRDRLLEIML